MRGFLARPARGQNLRMNFPGYLEEVGAGSGNRTRILSLEGCCTTTVLYPRGADRGTPSLTSGAVTGRLESAWWGKQDSNLRRRTPADLQSAPFAARDIPPRALRSALNLSTRLGRLATPFEQKPPPTTPAGARPGGCIAE